jgi:hypothetical protein
MIIRSNCSALIWKFEFNQHGLSSYHSKTNKSLRKGRGVPWPLRKSTPFRIYLDQLQLGYNIMLDIAYQSIIRWFVWFTLWNEVRVRPL